MSEAAEWAKTQWAQECEEAARLNFHPRQTVRLSTEFSICQVCAALVFPINRPTHARWHADNGESHTFATEPLGTKE